LPQLRLERGESIGVAERAPDRVGGEDASVDAYARLKPGPGRSAAEVAFHQRDRINRAVVEVVARRGYRRATIREIAGVAGISTRAFYQHYSSKEECFLCAHRRVMRQPENVARRAQGSSMAHAEIIGALTEEWGRNPELARFSLFSPQEAGPAALSQSRQFDLSLSTQLAAGFAPSFSDAWLAQAVSAGVVAGLSSVARSLILDGRGSSLLEIQDDLIQWASALLCSAELEALGIACASADRQGKTQEHPTPSSRPETEDRAALSVGDAALLHSAVVKLAASGDPEELSVRDICAAAGVSRTCFNAHFASLEDCLALVEKTQTRLALDCASRVAEMGPPGSRGVYRALISFCTQIICDPGLANLCFGEIAASGEWHARRERRLVEGLVGLLDVAGLSFPSGEGSVAIEASLGAALGLIRGEICTGSVDGLYKMTPLVGYLALAPTIGTFEAMSSCARRMA
jgi:TetR/AcrR family transcriptional regulator